MNTFITCAASDWARAINAVIGFEPSDNIDIERNEIRLSFMKSDSFGLSMLVVHERQSYFCALFHENENKLSVYSNVSGLLDGIEDDLEEEEEEDTEEELPF